MDSSRDPHIDPPKTFCTRVPSPWLLRRDAGSSSPEVVPHPRPPAPVPFLAKHYVSSDTENQEVGRDLEEFGYKVRALLVHSGP